MRELTVISGKGGTGKTTVVAAFASMVRNAVIADCDVDAADLHLILKPEVLEEHVFESGYTAVIHPSACNECGECVNLCRFDAISDELRIDPLSCEGCGVCADNCPVEAVHLEREFGGKWFVSETRYGPMVHARLGVAQENSGRLVSIVRGRAKEIAKSRGLDVAIVDGSPGIGCPVISSVTGTDLALVVAEPTQSGRHDLDRVLELTRHFRVRAAVCVNKHDLNPDMTEQIRALCTSGGATFVGTIPYDPDVTRAMVAGMSVTEFSNGAPAWAMSEICTKVMAMLDMVPARDTAAGDDTAARTGVQIGPEERATGGTGHRAGTKSTKRDKTLGANL
jgi:MinD superfamily P-loop ATPase